MERDHRLAEAGCRRHHAGFIGALPGGEAYPNNVEVTSDGRPTCGISGWYAASDFWVHSPAGALLVALTDDPVIAFVPIGR